MLKMCEQFADFTFVQLGLSYLSLKTIPTAYGHKVQYNFGVSENILIKFNVCGCY
jgi:hypothetical protein